MFALCFQGGSRSICRHITSGVNVNQGVLILTVAANASSTMSAILRRKSGESSTSGNFPRARRLLRGKSGPAAIFYLTSTVVEAVIDKLSFWRQLVIVSIESVMKTSSLRSFVWSVLSSKVVSAIWRSFKRFFHNFSRVLDRFPFASTAWPNYALCLFWSGLYQSTR